MSQQLVIRYMQKNLKSLCYYLYGDEEYYEGKLNMYDMFYITFIASPIFIQYHFVYKRKGYLPMFKGDSGTSIIHANLDEKNALLLVKKHYKWLVLNVTYLGLGLLWLIGSSFLYGGRSELVVSLHIINAPNIFKWLAISIGIGGMIIWMITYQLCFIYFRRHKKDIAYILYSDKKYYDKKMDGYDIHFFIIAMAGIYMNYHLKYKKYDSFKIPQLAWYPLINDKSALKMYQKHNKLLMGSFFTFILMAFWVVGSGLFIWLAMQSSSQ